MADWHALEATEAVAQLDSSRQTGLASEEAKRRLERYGRNELRETKRTTWLEVLLRQLRSVLIYILLAAAALALFLGEVIDAVAIALVILLIGGVGFVQEWRAEETLSALRRMLTLRARVRRDGVDQQIDALELVPGDIVALEVGVQVPADVRLLETVNFRVDESAFTGESVPVSKDVAVVAPEAEIALRTGMAYMGTVVSAGWGVGVVVATGQHTELGRIAHAAQLLEPETTPLQRRLDALGRQLGLLALSGALVASLAGLLQGRDLLGMLLVGLALAVAAVPEGLPAVVTLTLALGVRNMARRRALLRKVSAAEGLGAATIICTDKTGTLTQNEMTVLRVSTISRDYSVSGVGYAPEGAFHSDSLQIQPSEDHDLRLLLTIGMLCNHSQLQERGGRWEVIGDPTEGALLTLAAKAGLRREELGRFRPVHELSFDSSRKRMTVMFQTETEVLALTKGAPEVLLERCTLVRDGGKDRPLQATDRDRVEEAVREMSGAGIRTLGFAYRTWPQGVLNREQDADEVEGDLVFVGVVGMMDPLRPEVPAAVRLAQQAGVDVMMITGDAPLTAQAIGRLAGIGSSDDVLRGKDLERLSDAELTERLREARILARVSPEHKLRVVRLLKAQGHVVAMTGDGVNDAPALQQADIGVAMGLRGTDVAKGAADMILLDDNFASIVSAVEEGRRQYDNIEKFTRCLLAANLSEVLVVVGSIALGYPLILLPIQILWVNLVSDSLPALSLGLEPPEKDVMRRPPRDPQGRIVSLQAVVHIGGVGVLLAFGVGGLFAFTLGQGASEEEARTVAFTAVIMASTVIIINFRSLRNPIFELGFFRNPAVLVSVAGVNLLHVGVVYLPFFQTFLGTVPLQPAQWLPVLGYTAFMVAAGEVTKRMARRLAPSHDRPAWPRQAPSDRRL
jgi:Ca2+-transporting ATPase